MFDFRKTTNNIKKQQLSGFISFLPAALCAGALVTMLITPAWAGFEWTPPVQTPASMTVPVVQAMPAMQPIAVEPAMPAPDMMPMQALPVDPYATSYRAAISVENTVIERPAYQMQVTPMPVSDISPSLVLSEKIAPPVSYELAQGFGSDIALALTLRQLVPDDYSYSFDPGINPGMPVSWNGGKAWNVVLEEALAPVGLGLVISDKTVWIRSIAESEKQNSIMAMAPEIRSMAVTPASSLALQNSQMKHLVVPTIQVAPLEVGPMTPVPVAMAPVSYHAPVVSAPVIATSAPLALPSYMQRPMSEAEKLALYREMGMRSDYQPSYQRRTPMPAQDIITPAPTAPAKPVEKSFVHQAMMKAEFQKLKENVDHEPIALPPTGHLVSAAPMPMVAMARPEMMMPAMPAPSVRPAVMDPYEIRFWRAEEGRSLKDVLATWSEEARVSLLWEADYDYNLIEPVQMHGTFPEIVNMVLNTYNHSKPRPAARLHPNLPAGPSVLIVQ